MVAANRAYSAEDDAKALALYLPLARTGNSEAQFRVARIYTCNKGVTPNDSEACNGWEHAASSSDSTAAVNLGLCFESGAIAVLDGTGATLFFSATPIGAEERKAFQLNAYPKDSDPAGKPRSMMHFMFCPGGGKPVPAAAAVTSVEMSMALASSPIAQRQWVFKLPKDSKEFAFKALSGSLKPGGRLVGHATGAKTSDGLNYAWDVRFDVAAPTALAAAGPSCGG